jgi:hypothetical protein
VRYLMGDFSEAGDEVASGYKVNDGVIASP